MSKAGLVRHGLAGALICAIFPQLAGAVERACRVYGGDRYYEEWVASNGQQGARLVILDPRWQFGELGHHATAKAVCQSCPAGQVAQGLLWFTVSDTPEGDLDEQLAIDNIANHMAGFPYKAYGAKFLARGAPETVSFAGHEGRARLVRIEFESGVIAEVIAVAIADGCASLFGILHAAGGTEVSLRDLDAVNSAIGLETYKPGPDPRASEILAEAEDRAKPPPRWSLEDIQRALKGDNR